MNLMVNWKTSSAGILSVCTGLAAIGFAIQRKTLTEDVIATSVTSILTGFGLLFARDYDKSSEASGAQVPTVVTSSTGGVGKILSCLALLPLLLLSGCVMAHPKVSESVTDPKTGITTTKLTEAKCWTLGQGKAVLDKLRLSNGKTQSINQTGLSQETDALAQTKDAFVEGLHTARDGLKIWTGSGASVTSASASTTPSISDIVAEKVPSYTAAYKQLEDGNIMVCYTNNGKPVCYIITK